ncbi:two-component system sensor histidine kinase DesK [Streptomyces sp. LBL]|uniref:sensor histidine kinase n=1 Tax=Streptomyces sp. LBL TaxID=2940562 RepID=UPI00247630B7|nr:histidine kinase [Streptomyces sp. LBL]MDH6629815.1 two-component system sensor histidine kinase DesK [Streptomyces sp. LBL]
MDGGNQVRGPARWWRDKSTPAKVETYTRWCFHFFTLTEVVSVGPLVLGLVGAGPATWPTGWLALMVCVHGVVCAMTVSAALDWTRGRREQPVRMLWTLGSVTAVIAVAAIGIAERGPEGDGVESAAAGVFVTVLVFGAGIIALGVRRRRRVFAVVAGFAAGSGLVAFPIGLPGPATLVIALSVLAGAGFLAITSAFSVWLLDAVYELDEARETRARLAVAEERLRFGRDLHDVMGRNLAVIALKSELAAQLARRGRPEAVEQMIEVQRIARESQREVRDVVRGYREADLEVELAGAKGVLTAAGIRCEVTGGAVSGLPAEVQSALGWVVREATTNVLRHGDAERCTVAVRVTEGQVGNGGAVTGQTVAGQAAEEQVGNGGAVTGQTVATRAAEEQVGNGGAVTGQTVAGQAVARKAMARGTVAARAVLTVENDGVRSSGGSGGSGLAGLRERLAAVDGTLEAGFVDGGVFRVVAEVPLSTVEVDAGVDAEVVS